MSTSETMFVRLTEYNDHEGETWSWWLQLTGNEQEIDKLFNLVWAATDEDPDPAYGFERDEVEPESVVDKLVKYADSGYYAAHNKVAGRLTCPDDLSDDGEELDKLYKGGVKDFFTKDAA